MLIKSDYNPTDEMLGGNTVELINNSKYTGTDFHISIQQYLAMQVDTGMHFKDKARSMANQSSIKEIRV